MQPKHKSSPNPRYIGVAKRAHPWRELGEPLSPSERSLLAKLPKVSKHSPTR